jgi:hypothetical protein
LCEKEKELVVVAGDEVAVNEREGESKSNAGGNEVHSFFPFTVGFSRVLFLFLFSSQQVVVAFG